jgi:acetyl esterase/lipase
MRDHLAAGRHSMPRSPLTRRTSPAIILPGESGCEGLGRGDVVQVSVLERTPPAADLRVAYDDAPEQFADLRLPAGPGPFPALAFIHGGFWRSKYDLSHAGHICAALTEAGIATWNLEYRRIGNEGGGWPGTFQDIARGLRKLFEVAPEYDIDRDRVVVMGHSAGGHLAIWSAGLSRIPKESPVHAEPLPMRAAISLAGAVDLREVWRLGLGDGVVCDLLGGTPERVPDRYAAGSPADLLPLGVPHVIIHGVDDDIVPLAIGEGYVASAAKAGDDVTLLALPNTDHFAVIDPESEIWQEILAAILPLFTL